VQNSHSLEEILSDIKQLAAQDNLASVLIHMNDTYFIDERSPDIPGMARVAGLARTIRETVFDLVKEDRTLVLHSGDYLSPSTMSMAFDGAPMVELLKTCGVDFATIGNHEFDFNHKNRDILWDRMQEMQCIHLLANLDPPIDWTLPRLAFWPETKPFLAITGLVGKQTIGKAIQAGFVERNLRETATEIVNNVRNYHPGVGTLVVLSHMDRAEEDKLLQEFLSDLWGEHGFLYLLGGHDHNISWPELDYRYCYLSKCKSNCKSISVFLLPKDGIAAPLKGAIGQTLLINARRERERLIDSQANREASLKRLRTLFEWGSEPIPDELLRIDKKYPDCPLTREELMAEILREYRGIASVKLRDDFRKAFERLIQGVLDGMGQDTINEAVALETLTSDVLSWAAEFAFEGFRGSIRKMTNPVHLFELPIDTMATAQVEEWTQKLMDAKGADPVIADFTSSIGSPDAVMDATDDSLRFKSTDFGNFVADAIKAATEADVALVNAGAFRIDSLVPAKITLRRLQDVFVYDKSGAIATVDMEVDEVLGFYDLAVEKPGHGRFLQVSESRDSVKTRTGTLKVALITHMLVDKEDGYQSKLALARKVDDAASLTKEVKVNLCPDLIVDLIEKGVRKGVTYSRQNRLSAIVNLELTEKTKEGFVPLVDNYCAECREAGIVNIYDQMRILDGCLDQIPERRRLSWDQQRLSAVAMLRDQLREFVSAQVHTYPPEVKFSSFEKYLKHDHTSYSKDVPYPRYLEAILYRMR
jgi:2',3'-cyclic-nucleotide 2'-phosphodiesterase (5'-nucleotidase family)